MQSDSPKSFLAILVVKIDFNLAPFVAGQSQRHLRRVIVRHRLNIVSVLAPIDECQAAGTLIRHDNDIDMSRAMATIR